MTTNTLDDIERTYDPVIVIARLDKTIEQFPHDARAASRLLRNLNVRGHYGDGKPTALDCYLSARVGALVTCTHSTISIRDEDWSYHRLMPGKLRTFDDEVNEGHFPWLDGDPTIGDTKLVECHVLVVE